MDRQRPGRKLRLLALLAVLAALAAFGLKARLARHPRAPAGFPRTPEEFLPAEKREAEAARLELRLKENPDDLHALVQMGLIQFQRGRDHYIDGINALEEARNLGALEVRVPFYLGAMYQELGLVPFAIAEYQRFLRNSPEDRDVRLRLAKLEYQEGRYAEAAKEYENLYAEKTEDPLVRENLALSLMGAGRPHEARFHFEGLSQANGETARRAHFFLGKLASQNREYPLAATHLEKARSGGGPVPGVDAKELYLQLAQTYDKLKLAEKSRPAWEQVLALDPGNKEAKTQLRKAAKASRIRHSRGDAGRLFRPQT